MLKVGRSFTDLVSAKLRCDLVSTIQPSLSPFLPSYCTQPTAPFTVHTKPAQLRPAGKCGSGPNPAQRPSLQHPSAMKETLYQVLQAAASAFAKNNLPTATWQCGVKVFKRCTSRFAHMRPSIRSIHANNMSLQQLVHVRLPADMRVAAKLVQAR